MFSGLTLFHLAIWVDGFRRFLLYPLIILKKLDMVSVVSNFNRFCKFWGILFILWWYVERTDATNSEFYSKSCKWHLDGSYPPWPSTPTAFDIVSCVCSSFRSDFTAVEHLKRISNIFLNFVWVMNSTAKQITNEIFCQWNFLPLKYFCVLQNFEICHSMPGPGSSAITDKLKNKLGQITRPDDDVIIGQIGWNNIPEDSATPLIDKLDEFTDELRKNEAPISCYYGPNSTAHRQSQLRI